MAVSLIAVDYSRPIQPIFLQEPRIGTVHSIFNKATNITFDGTMLALLSDELPRMPNSVRLRSDVTDKLFLNLKPGMEVCVGNDTLVIPTCNFSFHLADTPLWEPRPDVNLYQWNRETVAQHTRLLTQFLAKKQHQGWTSSPGWTVISGATASRNSSFTHGYAQFETARPGKLAAEYCRY